MVPMLPSVSSPAVLSAPPNALNLLKALRRRWLAASVTAVVAAALAVVGAWLFIPMPKATARTLLEVRPGNVFLFRTNEPIPSIPDHQRTQIALIKSRWVLREAINQLLASKSAGGPDLPSLTSRPNPVEWLEKEVYVDFSVAPHIVKISLSGDNENELTKVVHAIREAYRKEVLEKGLNERRDRLKMLADRKQWYENRLKSRKQTEEQLTKGAGARDANARANNLALLGQQFNWVDREYFSTRSELHRIRAELKIRKAVDSNSKAGAKPAIPQAVLEEMFNKDPAVVKRRAEIRQIEDLIESTLTASKLKERDPTVIGFRKQKREAEESLNAQRKVQYPKYEEEVRQKSNFDLTQTAGQLQSRVEVLEEEEKYLIDERERLRKEIESTRDNSQKLDTYRDDTTHLEDMFKKIQAEHAALDFEINIEAPKSHYDQDEIVVIRPSPIKQMAITYGGAVIAAVGVVALAFSLLEFRLRRVSNTEEISEGLGMTVVGSIPDCNGGASRKRHDVHQVLVEAVEAIRTMLIRASQAEPMRVLMVTSAYGGEGKTSLATHLAASLAEVGRRTLLIDGDLRNPIAHRLFGLDLSPGFCEVLRGDADVGTAIRTTRVAGLSMLTAGVWDGRATRQLAQGGVVVLLERLRQEFEFVIIDCSPVLPVVDPLLIGQHVDGAILSTLRDVSRMPSVYAAHQRLTAGGVRVLGAVVNGVRGELYGAYPYRPTTPALPEPGGTQAVTNG